MSISLNRLFYSTSSNGYFLAGIERKVEKSESYCRLVIVLWPSKKMIFLESAGFLRACHILKLIVGII